MDSGIRLKRGLRIIQLQNGSEATDFNVRWLPTYLCRSLRSRSVVALLSVVFVSYHRGQK